MSNAREHARSVIRMTEWSNHWRIAGAFENIRYVKETKETRLCEAYTSDYRASLDQRLRFNRRQSQTCRTRVKQSREEMQVCSAVLEWEYD